MNLQKPSEKVTVVYKCRQSGFTTSIKGKGVQRAYFKKVPQILIASAGINQSMKVLRDIKGYFNSMPDFMRPEFQKETETILILANGVEIVSLPFNPETCRGFTGDVNLDEFGVKNRKESNEIWEALVPTITKGYNLNVISTPKGKDNMFYDLCNPKKDDEGNITGPQPDRIIRVHWSDVPHVAAEIDALRKLFHPKQFLQEYECEFLDDTDHALFPYDFMMEKVVDNSANPVQPMHLGPVEEYGEDKLPEDKTRKNELRQLYPNGIYMGWDAALTGDGSIVGVFGVTKDDIWKLIAYKKFPKDTDLSVQIPFVSRLAQFVGAKRLTFDATGAFGLAIYDYLKRTPVAGILNPFKFTPTSKAQEYSHLRAKMEQEGFRIPEIQECIKEFANLGLNPVTGRIAAQGNRQNHDDWPSMFICAYSGRNKRIVDPGFHIIVPRR
jgi:phage FluMu gp28-like protein